MFGKINFESDQWLDDLMPPQIKSSALTELVKIWKSRSNKVVRHLAGTPHDHNQLDHAPKGSAKKKGLFDGNADTRAQYGELLKNKKRRADIRTEIGRAEQAQIQLRRKWKSNFSLKDIRQRAPGIGHEDVMSEQEFEEYKQAHKKFHELESKIAQLDEEADAASRQWDEIIRLAAEDRLDAMVGNTGELLPDDPFDAYNAVRRQYDALRTAERELVWVANIEGVDVDIQQDARVLSKRVIDQRRQQYIEQMQAYRDQMNDGAQSRLPFDDGERGKRIERAARMEWHRERVVDARKRVDAARRKQSRLGSQDEVSIDELARATEEVEQAEKEYRQFNSAFQALRNRGTKKKYFRKAEDTELRLGGERDDIEAFIESTGATIDVDEINELAGAAEGAVTEVEHADDYSIELKTTDGFVSERTINADGTIYNAYFRVDPERRGEGLGTEIFARQVEAARAAGFERIETQAAGDKHASMNGYYTWARLGYDAEIPDRQLESLPEEFEDATMISDLMKTQKGRDWWKENGSTVDMVFDLDEDSLSSRRLEAYLVEKGMISDSDPEEASEPDDDEMDELIFDHDELILESILED